MINFGSTEDLYQCLKSTSVKGITFTVEPLYKADPHDESTTSKVNNYNVMLQVAVNSSDGKTVATKIDFSGFDETANRIMAKAVQLLILINSNTSLETLSFNLRSSYNKNKSQLFFRTFCIEMLKRVKTNNKNNLSGLSINTTNQYLNTKEPASIKAIQQFIEKNPNLENLTLSGMKLEDNDLEPILNLLKAKKIKLKDLDLSENILSAITFEKIFNYLDDFKSLECLDLSGQDTEGQFIVDESLFKILINTLKTLPHPLQYLGLANLSIDDCAFHSLFSAPEIVAEKIIVLDVSDNELSNNMIGLAESAFIAVDSKFEFHYYDCQPEGVLSDFMWGNEQAIHQHLHGQSIESLSEIDSNYNTPAHYLAKKGDLEGLKHLKNLGVNLNEKNHYGFTPLHIAINYSKKEVVIWLLQDLKPAYLMQPSFLVTLVLSDDIDMFNLLQASLKKQFTKFLKLRYEGFTFTHQLAHQCAIILLTYALKHGFISKTQLEARYSSAHVKSMENYSALMIGLITENFNKDQLFEFFQLMVHQKVEVRYDDIVNINTYIVNHLDELSPEQLTLHKQLDLYHRLRHIFDTFWRDYSLSFDSHNLSFTVKVSQAKLRNNFKVTNDFTLFVDSILKYMLKNGVDIASARTLEEKNSALIEISNQLVSNNISIDLLTQHIISLKQRPKILRPKQTVKQVAQINNQEQKLESKLEPKLEPKLVKPPSIKVPTPSSSITHSLPVPEESVYEASHLYKKKSQKKPPPQGKQKVAHGQGKNNKNLKKREKFNKRIAKEAAKERLKTQREENRLEKEAERKAKEQQKAEEARLARAPLQLPDANQGFFHPGGRDDDNSDSDSDGEYLFKAIHDKLMAFNKSHQH